MNFKDLRINLFRFISFVIFALALGATSAVGQSRVPQFKEYPITEAYIGKTAPLIITREDKLFRTRLREAAKEKPNFAGRYIVTTWGCGTSCVMGAVIDAKTGKVHWWNFSVCCWGYEVDENFQPMVFRLNSNLIVFAGARNEKDGDIGTHFYKFENGRFVYIRSILKKDQGGS